MSAATNPTEPPAAPMGDDPTEDLRRLEAEAEALRAIGRHEAAAQLLAWRDLHAMRLTAERKREG